MTLDWMDMRAGGCNGGNWGHVLEFKLWDAMKVGVGKEGAEQT